MARGLRCEGKGKWKIKFDVAAFVRALFGSSSNLTGDASDLLAAGLAMRGFNPLEPKHMLVVSPQAVCLGFIIERYNNGAGDRCAGIGWDMR
jgi:hypothetical protein